MAIKTIYLGSEGPFKYDDTELVNDPDGLFAGILQNTIVTDGNLFGVVVGGVKINDTDESHTLELKWNEDDIADRILNILVGGADKTLDLRGSVTGDILRYNSVSGGWEVSAEPLSFTQINLTPAAAAILDIEGGMWYKSGDKSVYVCTDV